MRRVATLVAQRLAWMMATELGHGAQGIALDWAAPGFTEVMRQLGVELLIHTAGPFQQQDYAVAKAAAAAAAHYIDLADGRRFVCVFPAAMDATFLTAGRTGISGASTVPALSSAVVEQLCLGRVGQPAQQTHAWADGRSGELAPLVGAGL